MAKMSRTWAIFTAVILLTLQLCKACSIWSSAGSVVPLGSSFTVYCNFECNRLGEIYSRHPPTKQRHGIFNSTTISHDVVNITQTRTFSCMSSSPCANELCGTDIKSGCEYETKEEARGFPVKAFYLQPSPYPPEKPRNISCTYNVRNDESTVVLCEWKTGRDTHLDNEFTLWVKTVSENHTAGPKSYEVSSKRTNSPSTSFTTSSSERRISVWVEVKNKLGSATSATVNHSLRDIARPPAPVLEQPGCSSRRCDFKVGQLLRTHHLEIQFSTETQTWTSFPDSVVKMSQAQVLSVSSLEPYRLYHFKARSKFSHGLWSEWSTIISGWTQEEAPAEQLDVWSCEASPDASSLRVYWKEPNISIARGKILHYNISVFNQRSKTQVLATSVNADVRNYTVQFCADCQMRVWVCNSIGSSPPAMITTKHIRAKPPQNVHVTTDNHSIAIFWRKPETEGAHTEYVLEWYPQGHKLDKLRWVRLGKKDNYFVITGLKPAKCYEGAVYVSYNDGSVDRTRFTGVILESVPSAGPSVQESVDGDSVKVTWTEIPRDECGGCITQYTIHLESSSGHQQLISVQAPQRTHTIPGLSSATYSLWMTASTAKGEGPAGQKVKFYIRQETQLFLPFLCVAVAVITLFLLCLWQCSAVKQRFSGLFECLIPNDVLDPANSKWAKECIKEKDKINLQLPKNAYSVPEEEEEPILVEVEELPNQSSEICPDESTQLPPETSPGPLLEKTTVLYPLTTYIKSFSQDSDTSAHTDTSMDTNSTNDYISSHDPGGIDEGDEEGEEFPEMVGFFPTHNVFMEPMAFGGKLTLDAVKFNSTDLF